MICSAHYYYYYYYGDYILKQDKQYTCNVTLGRVHETIFAMEN